ncbi:Positive regulator of sigma E activity [Bacteroidales bacterium Barb4]|nr:Positive regulator of sigma E activity [Bacteroidales bacterium Barb4]
MREHIQHSGVIERIDGDSVVVRIVQQSACAACHAKGMCSVSESKVKRIEVTGQPFGRFHVNEEVMICGQSSMGLEAVFVAFVLPLMVVVGAIAGGIAAGLGEAVSALSGLLLLAPYYLVLYLLRDRLKKRFVFTLQKSNQL